MLRFTTSAHSAPAVIFVSGDSVATPYRMDGQHYSGEQLKLALTPFGKEFRHQFAKPNPEAGGLVIYADEKATFAVVMRLIQLLKEVGVIAYRVEYHYRESPRGGVQVAVPVISNDICITRVEVEPERPKENPAARIKEIVGKMGGAKGK